MIVSYFTRSANGLMSIELCGEFRDWDHFNASANVERLRGWIWHSPKVVPR